MSEIYLAKSDLTGAVYAVNGKSKTDVTDFVTQLIKVETEALTAEVEKLSAVNKVLRGGLEVYADYSNWYFSEHEQADCFHHSGSVENGQTIAQSALDSAARIDENRDTSQKGGDAK